MCNTPFFRHKVTPALIAGFFIVLSFSAWPQASSPNAPFIGSSDKIVPFVPTPPEIVEKMLAMAQVDKLDTVYDLGSGDGRIVIMAAQKFGAKAVGVELDEDLFKKSTERIAELGLQDRAKILKMNFFDVDLRPATVLTLYLLTSVNERLRPKMERELRPGARVVSHDFQVTGWKAEKVESVNSENGISHTLYLYILPAPKHEPEVPANP
ncbi:MAG TPA: class I SAM-dependent methyltransferase [Terriglobia bacterium]|jgi:SAM-dependent methyltransferase|nr:class I SAM-dependent methyltransferase [Terriglobia bacterium]